MNVDDVLALFGEERPARWLQYHDGSWAPVWQDGWVGEPFTIADLLQVVHDPAALEEPGANGNSVL